MAAKNQFPSRDIKFPTKKGKATFPKEFFLEIWLIIEDCKYNYTAEIKFEKSSVAHLWGKQILNSALKMLISRTCAWLMQFFFHQKRLKVKLDKVREGLQPITLHLFLGP